VITFLGGVQLLSIGVVGEYVGKTYFETKQRPLYVLRDVVQSPPDTADQGAADQDTAHAPAA